MATLTLKIEGPPGRVPAPVFARVLTESLEILDDLRRTMRGKALTWYVTGLVMASASATLEAEDTGEGEAETVASSYVTGLQVAESGDGLPAYFSDRSLRRVMAMTKELGTRDARYLAASMNGSTPAVVTNIAAANIGSLRMPRTQAEGSITGILDTISLRKREKGKFQVLDSASHRPVYCEFPVEQIEVVKGALLEQVTVRGIVTRNAKGQPVRINDAEFELVASAPRLADLVGIDPNFTGGLPLSDYMDRLTS